jgi:hypothetical protein
MLTAQIGPLTSVAESMATAVGAGILLGGFAMGAVGVAAGWPRQKLDDHVLFFGYAGGVVAVALSLLDLALRYSR